MIFLVPTLQPEKLKGSKRAMLFAETGVIDAHHHLWKLDALDYGWLKRIGEPKPFGDPTPIQRDYLADDLRRDADQVNLVGSIHVQCDPKITDPVTETEFVQSIADDAGFPNAIVGFVDMTQPDAPDVMERHGAFGNFRGVRHIICNVGADSPLNFAPPGLLSQPTFQENLSCMIERDLLFELQMYPNQAQEAAAAFPHDLKVVIDHCGGPHDMTAAGLRAWQEQLRVLAERENTAIKICGLGMYKRDWSLETLTPLFDSLLDVFGTERIMLGSNFPVDSLMRSYRDIFADYEAVLAPLSTGEQQAIAVENAKRIYAIEL